MGPNVVLRAARLSMGFVYSFLIAISLAFLWYACALKAAELLVFCYKLTGLVNFDRLAWVWFLLVDRFLTDTGLACTLLLFLLL